MRDVCLLEPESHWSDESFVFGRFTCVVFWDNANFGDLPFPCFFAPFTGFDDFEDFGVGLSFDAR